MLAYHSCTLKCYENTMSPVISEFKLPHAPFYFMRHGETDWNKTNLAQGSTDIPLNNEGIEQAHKAAQKLTGLNIATIISSPLKRALKTAEIVAEYLGKTVTIVDEVKEAHWGVAEGKAKIGEDFLTPWKNGKMYEGAECYPCFSQRVCSGVHKALQYPSPVLIIAHGGVYWPLQTILGQDEFHLPNGLPVIHTPPEQPGLSWNIEEL